MAEGAFLSWQILNLELEAVKDIKKVTETLSQDQSREDIKAILENLASVTKELLLRMSSASTFPVLEMIATPLIPSNCQN